MIPTLLTVDRPSAVSAAMRWLNPPRRSGTVMSAPCRCVGPVMTAACSKSRRATRRSWPSRPSLWTTMSAPISLSASVKPKRFSYTVSWMIETPGACVSATTSGCCQSVMKPGCTSVSMTTGLRSPPGW